MQIEQYRDTLLLLMVSIAAVNDLATRRIPNRLLLAGLAGALFLHGFAWKIVARTSAGILSNAGFNEANFSRVVSARRMLSRSRPRKLATRAP